MQSLNVIFRLYLFVLFFYILKKKKILFAATDEALDTTDTAKNFNEKSTSKDILFY